MTGRASTVVSWVLRGAAVGAPGVALVLALIDGDARVAAAFGSALMMALAWTLSDYAWQQSRELAAAHVCDRGTDVSIVFEGGPLDGAEVAWPPAWAQGGLAPKRMDIPGDNGAYVDFTPTATKFRMTYSTEEAPR